MQIFQLDPRIISSPPYLNPAPNKDGVVRRRLDIECATVDFLPDDIEALLVTTDLQGRKLTVQHDPGRLMGCAVVDHLTTKQGRQHSCEQQNWRTARWRFLFRGTVRRDFCRW